MANEPDSAAVAAIEELIVLINPTEEGRDRQLAAFRQALPRTEAERNDGNRLIWILKDIIDGETAYFVGWKDTRSFVQCMDKVCARWNVTIDWGVPNAGENQGLLDQVDLPSLLQFLFGTLEAQGLTLWSWDTANDCYGGWIARSANDDEIRDISSRLNVDFY